MYLLGNCRDTGKYCSYHVPRGDCDTMKIVRERCKKSCKLCGEGKSNSMLKYLFVYLQDEEWKGVIVLTQATKCYKSILFSLIQGLHHRALIPLHHRLQIPTCRRPLLHQIRPCHQRNHHKVRIQFS